MKGLLTLRAALYGIAGLLAIFGVSHWFVAVFVQARFEVVYLYDVTVNHCTGQLCAYSATLEVANTGRAPQTHVEVRIDGLPAGLGTWPKILNLDASYPRASDPLIEQQHEAGLLRIHLRELTPGTLVEFTLRGFFPREQALGAPDPAVSVAGQGRMIEGNPRAVAFGRFFSRCETCGGPDVHRPPPHGRLIARTGRIPGT